MTFHATRAGEAALAVLLLLGTAAVGARAAEPAPGAVPGPAAASPAAPGLLFLRLARTDLEIDLDPVSTDGHAPQGPSPLAAGADAGAVVGDLALVLQALGGEQGIDPGRIAVVGLGTGGRAALLAGSEAAMSRELDSFGPRFAAHAAFYPGCGALLAEGFADPLPWSNAPAAAFHAGQDRQNGSSACETLGDALAIRRRPPALWHVYPTATYAWDLGAVTGQGAFRLANLGTAPVPAVPATDVAADAAERLIGFLRPILAAPGRR